MTIQIPDVTANDIECIPGKVLLAEYADVPKDAPRSLPLAVLDVRGIGYRGKTECELVAFTGGWELAGSMMRWTNGYFAVRYNAHGSCHSSRFRDYASARDRFEKLEVYGLGQ